MMLTKKTLRQLRKRHPALRRWVPEDYTDKDEEVRIAIYPKIATGEKFHLRRGNRGYVDGTVKVEVIAGGELKEVHLSEGETSLGEIINALADNNPDSPVWSPDAVITKRVLNNQDVSLVAYTVYLITNWAPAPVYAW